MTRFLKQIIDDQKGQALPIVLALLVVGGLMITPTLNYAATSLNNGRIIEKGVNGLYAADAGVEYALWCLENAIPPPQQLPENINQMEVALQTEEKGNYTLYFGELIQPGVHSDYISVTGDIVPEQGNKYKYTITITWQPGSGIPVIHLEGVGAKLPQGHGYENGSAAHFEKNLRKDEPHEHINQAGGHMVNWEPEPPYASVSEDNPVITQTFYINGLGNLENYYAWIVANRDDIGAVSEVTGTFYQITATATRYGDGKTTAKIVADVVIAGGTADIVSWQVSK